MIRSILDRFIKTQPKREPRKLLENGPVVGAHLLLANHVNPEEDLQKFIIFDTEFLVFDTQFLVFTTQFIIFTHRRPPDRESIPGCAEEQRVQEGLLITSFLMQNSSQF